MKVLRLWTDRVLNEKLWTSINGSPQHADMVENRCYCEWLNYENIEKIKEWMNTYCGGMTFYEQTSDNNFIFYFQLKADAVNFHLKFHNAEI
jgi:hypothetical protein